MRKVIQLTTVHGRYDVRIFLKECRSLASHGHDVTLVVQDGKRDETCDEVKIHDLGSPPAGRVRRILSSPLSVYRFLRSTPADSIIHFHDPELLPVALLLKTSKRFVIYDTHEDVPRQILTKHWIHPALRKVVSVLFEMLENYVAKRLDAVVCATPFIAKRFKQINKNTIDINNFPVLKEFQLSDNRQSAPFARTICYIGGITRERGITELLASLEILQDVTLIMCGPFESKEYEDELMSMAGWDYVDYRGIVGRDEVAKIMACSSVGVVTFLPGPNHNDSQPNKMFEYMSAGLPLLASNFPLWRQIVEGSQCGMCTDPSSPRDIASAITNLLADERMCRDMGDAGAKAVRAKFNWENESAKLLNLYEGLK